MYEPFRALAITISLKFAQLINEDADLGNTQRQPLQAGINCCELTRSLQPDASLARRQNVLLPPS
jgi:hypothetical protein